MPRANAHPGRAHATCNPQGWRTPAALAVGELGMEESLLEAVVEQRSALGRDGFPFLNAASSPDAMITRVGSRHAIGMPDALIAEFSARARGQAAPAAASGRGAPAPSPKIELKPLSAPIGTALDAEDDDAGVRAPQEQVRIRADLLDRLVNYAGEVAIYRARLTAAGASRGAMRKWSRPTPACAPVRRRQLDRSAIIARYQASTQRATRPSIR